MKKLIFIPILLLTAPLSASNLKITGARVSAFFDSSVEISFNISQENTISTFTAQGAYEPVKDCVWLFVKYSTSGVSGPWNHATIYIDSTGDAPGATSGSVSDYKGAFIAANDNKRYWTSNDVKVRWCAAMDGIAALPSDIMFKVMGIEMVYLSTSSFEYDVDGAGYNGSAYNNFGGGSQVTIGSINDVPSGCSTDWPNGYRAFYCAKYEISQAQYVDFLNCVDPNGNSGTAFYDSSLFGIREYYIKRDASRPAGTRYYITDGRDTLGCGNIGLDDALRYASWCGLRLLTEMEFERAARGSNNERIYPWGNTWPDTAVINSTETKAGTTYDCFLNYANFADNGDDFQGYDGPTPVGHYLSGLNISGVPVNRTYEQTGTSPYGIADLGANLWERVINCQSTTTPANGNGTVTWPASWSASPGDIGLRGGSFNENAGMFISNRNASGNLTPARTYNVGLRLGRTPN